MLVTAGVDVYMGLKLSQGGTLGIREVVKMGLLAHEGDPFWSVL